MTKKVLLKVEYDGSQFYGWQRQPDKRTVQGTLEEVLSKLMGQEIKAEGTSRTDAGVHSLGQMVLISGDFKIPIANLKKAINNALAGGMNNRGKISDIYISEVSPCAPDFHPRFDAKAKKYRYVIENCRKPNIFMRNYRYQISEPLDTDSMIEASKFYLGEHDFAAFQSAGGTPRESTVRDIYSVDIYRRGDNEEELVIDIVGNAFLYNMVRIMVGTLVDIGLGKKRAMDLDDIIASKDRQRAGHTAPPQGLCLVNVYYEFPEMEI